LLISFSAIRCNLLEETYRDDHTISDPDALSVTVLFPTVAEFVITQTKPTGKTQTVPYFDNSVTVKKLNDAGGEMKFLIRLFTASPQTADNVGLFAIKQSMSPEEKIDLGKSYATPLNRANAEIKILDTGSGDAAQNSFRGYYNGTYTLTKTGIQVAVGNIEGYVDYQGNFQYEISGYSGFRFLKGNGVKGATENDFIINATLVHEDSTSVAAIQDQFTRTGDKLDATFTLSNTDFDEIQINLIQL
jgi:hypothetical protein